MIKWYVKAMKGQGSPFEKAFITFFMTLTAMLAFVVVAAFFKYVLGVSPWMATLMLPAVGVYMAVVWHETGK